MSSPRPGRQNNAGQNPSPSEVDTPIVDGTDAGSPPTTTQTRSSFFSGTSGPVFDRGQFIGNQQIHFIFNHPSQFGGGGPPETPPPAQENQESPDLNVSRRPSPPSRILRVLGLGRFIRRRISQNRILRGNNSPLERDVFEVYKQHLLPKGLGHPLWIPQSNMRLPVPYRQTGVSIGDVGIITREGAFDFLFNICYPRDHPFNSRVPPDFEPFSPSISLDSNILEYREFSCNTFLTSDDIEADPTHPNGIQFTTSSPQGAILTMPRGAYIQRLANPDHFHEYIGNNAASWYRFVNGQLRRAARNGDIRIVLACRKSTSWGMAAVLNTSHYTQSQTLRFGAFQPYINYPHYFSYFWEAPGSARVKVGPEPGDNDGLLENQTQELLNQCLFVVTSTVTLGENAWSKLRANDVPSDAGDKENSQKHDDVIPPRVPTTGLPNTIPRSIENSGRQSSVALLSDAPSSDTIDHTKAITALLLQKHPEMQVAILQDNDWCSVLDNEDPTQVTSSDIFSRICTKNDIRQTSTGLVYFELKDQNPEKSPIIYTELEATDLLRSLQQDKATLRAKLLTNLPDLKHLGQFIQLGYFSYPNNGTISEQFPPFLMESPEDLFIFDKLLEVFESEDESLSPTHLDDNLTKSQAYKELDSPSFPQAHRRRYFKALGDGAWKRYLQFGRLDDLDETIWLYEKTISLTPSFTIQSLVPLFGLCSALYRRFVLKRNLHDFVHLARYARRQELIDFNKLIDLLPSVSTPPAAGDKGNDLTALETRPMPFLTFRSVETERPSLPLSEIANARTPSISVDLFAQLNEEYSSHSESHPITNGPPDEESLEFSQLEIRFKDMLNFTQQWIEDASSHTSILWLYGPSATSMVSVLIERQPPLKKVGNVGSTFTFSDTAPWNDEACQLFPTIAVELAQSIPGLLEQYRKIITDKGFQELMTASLEIQFWSLIVDPIRKLPSKHTRTVIINAIDNCGYETAKRILTLITNALVVFALPLRFLVASNRDTRLQDIFNRPSLSSVSRQFFVGTQPGDTTSPNGTKNPADVLRHGFQAICEQHPSLVLPNGKKWPSEDVFNILFERSRKNPIYADTVISFLTSVGGDPNTNLQRVLKPTPPLKPSQEMTAGFADLDSLFTHILSTYHNRIALVHALGILLVLHDCAQPQTILENIFGMRTYTYNAVLQVLRSLMHFPKVENEHDIHPWRVVKQNVPKKDQRVKSPFLVLALLSLSTMAMPTAFTIPLAFRDRVHDSFYDFLVNPERSGPFYVDIAEHHGHLTMAGFECVVKYMWRPSRLDFRLGRYPTLSPETWDYLTFHLPDHYSQCSDKVRERIIELLQDALIAVSRSPTPRDNAESDITVSNEEFLNNVAVLVDLIINDWESFGEWSHFTPKHTSKYTDFRRVMALIREDLFPRRSSTLRLRRLSGKFIRAPTVDSLHQLQQQS